MPGRGWAVLGFPPARRRALADAFRGPREECRPQAGGWTDEPAHRCGHLRRAERPRVPHARHARVIDPTVAAYSVALLPEWPKENPSHPTSAVLVWHAPSPGLCIASMINGCGRKRGTVFR